MSKSLCLYSLQFLIEATWCVIIIIGSGSSVEEPSKLGLKDGGNYNRHGSSCCSKLGGFFCGFLVREDCYKDDLLQQQSGDEDALFCTLCNAEVQDLSWQGLFWWEKREEKIISISIACNMDCLYSTSFSQTWYQTNAQTQSSISTNFFSFLFCFKLVQRKQESSALNSGKDLI